ncbi:inner membrane protein ynjI [Escherichia coli UMEA 3271-1]|nr:inner membrane protein ynjI [Escherichia coli UMEA 3271-1]
MKKVLLQNHPGSEKYSFNGWEIFNSNFERMIKENKAMLLCKWGFYLTCVVAVMFVFAAITSNGLNERGLITAGCSFLGNDSNLLIVFYVQIMPDDFVMQLHRF